MEVKPAVAAVIHCDVSEMGSWVHPDVSRKIHQYSTNTDGYTPQKY